MRCAEGMGIRAALGISPNIELILFLHKKCYLLALSEQTAVERAFGMNVTLFFRINALTPFFE